MFCIYIELFSAECVLPLSPCGIVYVAGSRRRPISRPGLWRKKIRKERLSNKQTSKKRGAVKCIGGSIHIRRKSVFMHVSRHLPKYKHTERPIPLCKGCGVRTPWVVRLRMISTQYDVVKQPFEKKRKKKEKMFTACFYCHICIKLKCCVIFLFFTGVKMYLNSVMICGYKKPFLLTDAA